jgi:NADH-ubiquinone oxidoreductase chain 2
MFSFVGLPPLAGFFAKQMVLTTALDNEKTMLVITAVFTSVIGAVYYLNVIKIIYFDNSDYEKSYIYYNISLSNIFSVTLSVFNILLISFILIPNEIINLTNLMSIINFSSNNF